MLKLVLIFIIMESNPSVKYKINYIIINNHCEAQLLILYHTLMIFHKDYEILKHLSEIVFIN